MWPIEKGLSMRVTRRAGNKFRKILALARARRVADGDSALRANLLWREEATLRVLDVRVRICQPTGDDTVVVHDQGPGVAPKPVVIVNERELEGVPDNAVLDASEEEGDWRFFVRFKPSHQ